MLNEFPDKVVTLLKLNDELAVLNLSGFIGAARIGRALNEEGRWASAPTRILVKCDDLTGQQRVQIQGIINAHIPEDNYVS